VRAEKKTQHADASQVPDDVWAAFAIVNEALAQFNHRPASAGNVEWVGVEEMARRLEVMPMTVRRLASKGDLPAGVLIGGSRRWDWSEVCSFMKSRQGLRPRNRGRGRPPKKMTAQQSVDVPGAAAE